MRPSISIDWCSVRLQLYFYEWTQLLNVVNTLECTKIESILRAPLWLFDKTPVGRIVNRFTKDLDIVDFEADAMLHAWWSLLGRLVMAFLIISIESPTLLILFVLGERRRTSSTSTSSHSFFRFHIKRRTLLLILVRTSILGIGEDTYARLYLYLYSKTGPIVLCYGVLLWIFLPTTRQLYRLEALARSRLFAHITESVHGTLLLCSTF